MQDNQIIDLYFARDERAITETDKKHGAVCMSLSLNILQSRPDAEECLNDTYLTAWNCIPPERPTYFRAFLCRIIRNLSLERFRHLHRQKRNRDLEVSLEELEGCIPMPEEKSDELAEHLSNFLRTQEKTDRLLFMGRYWHGIPVSELAIRMGMKPNTVTVRLKRTRERLHAYLSERGYKV
jgi:RNA polymerase sigma-70 factor (ECF subfamily)